jgi:tRNA(Ile)-lysidine synthase
MHPLEKIISARIIKRGLISMGDTVIAGVSGGPDSMALANILAGLRDKLNFSLKAVYIDHGLRPTETVQEKALLCSWTQNNSVNFKQYEVGVTTYAKKKKLSIEDAARKLRYQCFEKETDSVNSWKIAVAHTADDQAEEILIKLLRGSGRKGIMGMNYHNHAGVIRPFLDTTKSELLQYLEDKELPYCIDSSNLSPIFLRNQVRLELLPLLEKEFHPKVKRNLRQTANILQEEEELLKAITLKNYAKIIIYDSSESRDSHGIEEAQPNEDLSLNNKIKYEEKQTCDHILKEKKLPEIIINLSEFEKLHLAVKRRIIEMIFWKMECKPQFRQIEQITALYESKTPNGMLHLSKGLRAIKKEKTGKFFYPAGVINKRGNLVST